MARKYYNYLDYEINYESGKVVIYEETIEKIKKSEIQIRITGSNIWDLYVYYRNYVKKSPIDDSFGSSFNAAISRILGIGGIFGKAYVNAGNVYEDVVATILKESVDGFKEMKQIKPSDVEYDYFKFNKIDFKFNTELIRFGGIPDLIIPNDKVVVDIKTTNAKWFSKLEYRPINKPQYIAQLLLYKEMLGYKKAKIVSIPLEWPIDYMSLKQNANKESIDVANLDNEYILYFGEKIDINELIKGSKSAIDHILETGEICGFDLHNNFETLRLLEASNDEEAKNTEDHLRLLLSSPIYELSDYADDYLAAQYDEWVKNNQ